MTDRATRGRRGVVAKPDEGAIRREIAEADARAAAEIRALRLGVEREPVTVFRPKR